jgi:hypothetical protein
MPTGSTRQLAANELVVPKTFFSRAHDNFPSPSGGWALAKIAVDALEYDSNRLRAAVGCAPGLRPPWRRQRFPPRTKRQPDTAQRTQIGEKPWATSVAGIAFGLPIGTINIGGVPEVAGGGRYLNGTIRVASVLTGGQYREPTCNEHSVGIQFGAAGNHPSRRNVLGSDCPVGWASPSDPGVCA